MKDSIKVSIYSEGIKEIIEASPYAYVHSIFKNSLNLSIDNRLIHISTKNNEITPFSICIMGIDFKIMVDKLKIGDKLSTSIFDFKASEEFNTRIEAYKFNYDNLFRNTNFVKSIFSINLSWKRGIEESIDVKKDGFYREIIGKGPGLTPSGDDILVGLMAISTAMGSNRDLVQQIKKFILEEGRNKTTDIGYEYLYYASMDRFSKNVKLMCESLLKGNEGLVLESIFRLVRVGHTSGFDTLSGILLGIE